MKKVLFASIILFSATASAQVDISGSRFMQLSPAASTGLQAVYVIENSADATIEYTASTSSVQWQRFSNLGGGYAEPVTGVVRDGNKWSVGAGASDMGYIITDGSRQTCFWVVNYASCQWTVSGLTIAESDCDRVWLGVDGSAPEMIYYSINGHRETLDRAIEVDYRTLTYDSESHTYVQTEVTENLEYADGRINLPVPLCDTDFTINPDKFASAWGIGRAVSSPSFQTSAVQAQTTATQTVRESDNEQKVESEGLGGSAPCEIEFSAAVTDAAIYRRWEIASTPDFVDTYLTFDQLDFTYTFTEAGTCYVRFMANNAAGSCEYLGDTYTVAIGESRLECPNAFSPGTSEGVNDEWKVSYRSIISFDCQIFNRWGQKMATLTDPSQGWDGKYNGKFVKSGVYFYVIKATGSDGKEYKLSGDINIISSRQNPNSTTGGGVQ